MTIFRKAFSDSSLFVRLVLAVSLFSFAYFSLKLPIRADFPEFAHFYYYADVLREVSHEKIKDEEKLFELIAKPSLRQEAEFPQYEQMPKPTEVFLYPPILSFFFQPFLLIPYRASSIIWYGLNQLLFWGTLFLLFRLFAHPPSSPKGALILFASLNFFPVWMTLEAGQINLLTLFLLTLAFTLERKGKEILSGVCLGLAILTKIIPLPLLFYFGFRRRWRIVCAALAVVFIGYGVSIAVFGWPLHWVQWSRVSPAYTNTSIASSVNHQSLSAFWFHIFSQRGSDYPTVLGPFNAPGIGTALSWASRLLLLIVVFWSCRFHRRAKGTPSEFSLFMVVMLLLPSWLTTYHLIYLLFPVIALVTEDHLDRKEETCLLLAYLLIGTAYWLDGFEFFRRGWGVLFLHGRLYGMLLLGWILLKRLRRQPT